MEDFIVDICSYLIDNINNEISLEELENYFHYNRFYIIRLFKENTGYTITEFINLVRVLKSTDSLIYTNDTILKIALSNGYNSQEYYSEKFNNIIGMSPLKFRKIYTNLNKIEDKEKLIELQNYYTFIKDYQNRVLDLNNKNYTKRLVRIAK